MLIMVDIEICYGFITHGGNIYEYDFTDELIL